MSFLDKIIQSSDMESCSPYQKNIYDDIQMSLINLLNTRENSSKLFRNYGVKNIADIIHGDQIELNHFCRDIERLICEYEPRIRHVIVGLAEEHVINSRFELIISGEVYYENKSRKVNYRTAIYPNGVTKVMK
ncbi:lysozyme family protein [Piscirickettsia salmonis]|uniref:Type VI secretion system lysozyme-like protein n=2 Tax=Piscirickettsia salmonis TaxID=1238 RepID=A0A9Q5VN99_PISSA|nr:type VI secretion system baseplate subunit TssE [Piscirickettsia salmonis]RNC78487.1 type VI secretion system baseplate subunit TssE [Piscirickettsiaceae bacterium NZ-RLO2]ALA24105.1 Type VI secretion system lysozyme related protein [Piscirickettsia salmonis]APS44506.1 lysozyme family protein [Piscirickettsia salmonis]APS47867.1 lysozyme family protein [Piscirickettsia salmonis]APS51824.1 lysozyme family protein [Piscirickettsia salmonis]